MVFSRFSTIRKKSDHRTFASPSPMTHLHPYCPLLPHSPAALIRVDTCDARSHAFCGTHTATAQHLRGRRWLHISSTAHCSLFTAHWTYTFSAKEKDVETGLSYFGSRYYSSDLSIWLSVDPMSAKYPSLSPYTYCADNPVKLVDPNGEDYEVVVENNTITIRATYYAANEKDFKQLKKGLDSWNRQSGVYELQTGNGDSYTINFELTPVLDAEKFKDASRESNEIRGSTCNAFTIRDNYWGYQEDDRGTTRNGHVCYVKSNSPFRTTIHEIGHTLGLGEFNGDNVMTQGGNSAVITKKHIMRILDNVGFRCVGDSSNGDQITTPQAKGESSRVFSGIVKYKKQKK